MRSNAASYQNTDVVSKDIHRRLKKQAATENLEAGISFNHGDSIQRIRIITAKQLFDIHRKNFGIIQIKKAIIR